MLTKSDFLLFLEAPRHLWAKEHGQLEEFTLSDYERHLMIQGQEIEGWAQRYIQEYVMTQYLSPELQTQKSFSTDDFQVIADALIYDFEEKVYDLYEIKSATSVKKENLYDACFQTIVCGKEISLRDVYIVHLNGDYVRAGEINLQELFIVENVSEKVEGLKAEVKTLQGMALRDISQKDYQLVEDCLNPKTCPCPSLCHPNLPADPIYNIPRLHKNKKRDLKSRGLLSINDIPDGYLSSENQLLHASVVKSGNPHQDSAAILSDLEELQFPFYFLDYETYSPAIPMFNGYHPYQQIVFQYSLHILQQNGSPEEHFECLVTDMEDPAKKIVEQLSNEIGKTGTVIVWNKGFEAGRNKEMARLYPKYKSFLEDVNERIYDLADIFRKGYYVHPDFFGSYSIKKVLPVMAADVNYDGLPIPEGTQAMMAWAKIMQGELSVANKNQVEKDLLAYCKMDTFAMFRIWQELSQIV